MHEQEPRGSLAEAHDRIRGLMDDLESTLELVKRLSEAGEDNAALRLIDTQRSELYTVIDSLSGKVAARERTFAETVRRNIVAVAAAAMLVVSSIGLSVAMNRESPVTEAARKLNQAQRIHDPVIRTRTILEVYEIVRQLPPEQTSDVDGAVLKELEDLADDIPPAPENETLISDANRAVEDIQNGRQPTPPQPPSSEEGPIETIEGIVDDI